MAQPKSSDKSRSTTNTPKNPKTQNNNKDNPKTFGQEPPMVDPNTPEHPDDYEVEASSEQQDEKPILH